MNSASYLTLGSDWNSLQAWLEQIAELPATVEDFTERFGTTEDMETVRTFVDAVARVHALAPKIGGPGALKKALLRDPSHTAGGEPPPALYARLVWLAGFVQNAASTFVHTFEELPSLLSPTHGQPRERARALKQVLAGPAGLSIQASVERDRIRDVRDELGPLTDEVRQTTTIFDSVDPLAEANRTIGALRSTIPHLKRKRDETRRKAEGLFQKQRWRDETERLSEELGRAEGELTRKEALTAALDHFYVRNDRAAAALVDLDGQLNRLQAIFDNAAKRLLQFCSVAADDQLSSLSWITQALQVPEAKAAWYSIAASSRDFVERSLVEPSAA